MVTMPSERADACAGDPAGLTGAAAGLAPLSAAATRNDPAAATAGRARRMLSPGGSAGNRVRRPRGASAFPTAIEGCNKARQAFAHPIAPFLRVTEFRHPPGHYAPLPPPARPRSYP